MAAILRSGKIRYFVGLARSLVLNTHREPANNVIKNSQALCTTFTQGFASAINRSDQNLDRSIKKLDNEVRRAGRISRRDVEEVLDVIRLQSSASSSQSLLVIRCCGNLVPEELPEIRTALVQKIWQTLKNLNVQMDISHYNALLRVYLENEHKFSPTEFLSDLESNGIEPNRVTFQRLISRYCQEGDIDGATKILEFMRAKKHPINEHVFNALIMGHSEADDIESAVGILSVMKQAGLNPTADTYTVLLCAYAKHGKIDDILSTLDMCEANEIYLLDKDLFDIIYMLATNGHNDVVEKIIPKLRKSSGYNQDAVNVILRLVNTGQEDIAYDILKTMPRGTRQDGELADTGAFFIKQLVKSRRSAEKILAICKDLQEKGLNNRAILIAVETATKSGIIDIAVPLFKELQRNELPLRQHYFWPLLCAQAKIGPDAVIDVLQLMQNEFNMTCNGETIREFVVPNLKEKNYEKIVFMLRSAGVSTSTGVSSCVYDALTRHRIKEAATLASTYTIYYQPGLLRRPLVNALIETEDYESYISIVRSVYENLPRLQLIRASSVDDDEIGDTQSQPGVVGQFIVDAVIQLHNSRAEVLPKILSPLIDQGLSMSKRHAQRVQERLGSLLTPEISIMLDKLTAGDLEPVPYESRTTRLDLSDMPAEHLEKMILQKEAKGESVKGMYRNLLAAYIKANNVEKTEELIRKLESTDFVMTSGIYAQLIELHCSHNALDNALAVYAQIKAKEPDFVLDDLKTVKVVHCMIVNDRIDEAIEFLNSNKRDEKPEQERGFGYSSLCWRILDHLAEKGRDEDVAKVFKSLEENNFIEINNVLLGPLVKVHLINDDLPKAVATFETISTKYNCTPWKNELACKLIQLEDATNLQLLTDLSTNVHGEVNSLYDLVFSFVECGRIRQARKILETPGLRSRPQRINFACERYRREGKSASLEGLIQATRDLNHIDRNEIFYNLLLTYCKEDSPERALGLWTKIQEEEDVTPTDKFLETLAKFLKEKGVEIPFVVPATEATNVTDTPAKKSKSQSNETTNKVKKSLRSGNLDDAIKHKNNMKPNTELNVTDKSKMLELMVKERRLDAATKHITSMLESNTHPFPRIFRLYLNKIAETGNYQQLEQLSQLVTPEVKKMVAFDNRLCNAYVVGGKSEEYLNQLIKNFNDAATKEELDELEQKFPKGAMAAVLETNPQMIQKMEKFAFNAAEKGIYSPINVLWMLYVKNGQMDLADQIMKNYLRESPIILFNHILKEARNQNDEKAVQNLLLSLKDSKVSEGALGTVHSCLIDVYCAQEKYDDALNAVDGAIKDVCLENINRTALLRVKDGLEKVGKKFPHKIPDKKVNAANNDTSSSSSSSSSDDEPPVKK